MADTTAETEALAWRLFAALKPSFPEATAVRALRRLSGGASQETWAFELATAAADIPLILRRTPGGRSEGGVHTSLPLAVEAKLIEIAACAGVPVPRVRHVLAPDDGIGAGYVSDFVAGETIPRKILRDERYGAARARLAAQCGAVLAHIHRIDPEAIPELRAQSAREQLAQYRGIYDAFDDPRPVFELAFRWLEDHADDDAAATVVHGDFRNGNLIVGEDGLRAVLDWELAYVGDPAADLGWICVNSWRFGAVDRPVGGFGTRKEFLAAYTAAGGRAITPERIHYWEVFGTLKWGVICMMMYGAYRSGIDRSVERAVIGRRTSETEIDLLALLASEARPAETEPAPGNGEGSVTEAHHPTALELVEAVRDFLESRALPVLEGRTAFHGRVAINALDIALREGKAGGASAAAGAARLRQLLGDCPEDPPVAALDRELCRQIRENEMTLATPALAEHLWRSAVAQLAIDQPKYRPRPAGADG